MRLVTVDRPRHAPSTACMRVQSTCVTAMQLSFATATRSPRHRELSTPADIARLIARFNRRHQDLIEGSSYPAPTPFTLSVWPDPDDSTRYAAQLNQSGLGLPGRDYYFSADNKTANVREEYLAHIGRTLALAGETDAETAAKSVFGIETELARLQWTAVQRQDRNARRSTTLSAMERTSSPVRSAIFPLSYQLLSGNFGSPLPN